MQAIFAMASEDIVGPMDQPVIIFARAIYRIIIAAPIGEDELGCRARWLQVLRGWSIPGDIFRGEHEPHGTRSERACRAVISKESS